ncbi:MAG: hotdog fold thioesterase [Marinobacter sp.]|uniref:hotdog fold thioesterase n=1 Tax=Marinobacter sp. TaxID=50741 RepID=UPI00299E9282|nr:hotdog fold thioesterase [Marinobacter sp.]MDX1636097.1 hotdog fold thioesterase [Marinobacter sp.]
MSEGSIWTRVPTIESMTEGSRNTAVDNLGIEFLAVGENTITARMPVDKRTHQPFGLLHGGASVLLAETLGSVAANHCIRDPNKVAVGLEINANHIRSVRSGWVTGTTRPLHVGGSTQVWEIRIEDDKGKLVCTSRITMAVIPRPGA